MTLNQDLLRRKLRLVSFRYRAVASWSRVQGIGIPMITAIEIFSIWLLSFILAIPEAIGFTVVPFKYKDVSYVTCMLKPTNDFMTVSNILYCLFWNPQYKG